MPKGIPKNGKRKTPKSSRVRVRVNPRGKQLTEALAEAVVNFPIQGQHTDFVVHNDLVSKNPKMESYAGATSSKLDRRYDLVPQALIRRAAERYAEGIRKGHKEYNFRGGDESFVRARINHLQHHLYLLLSGVDAGFNPAEDDNLGAVIWAVSYLAELQETEAGREKFLQALAVMNPALKEKLDANA